MTESNSKFSVIEFCGELNKLKHLKRTGWVLSEVAEPETVASHMYRMAVLAMFLPTTVDVNRCVRMALVHDMAECIVGDLTPHCGVTLDDKHTREKLAFESLCTLMPSLQSEELYMLWQEYETGTSNEAQFVHDLDKFDMFMQAFEYEQRDNTPNRLQEFFTNARTTIKTELVTQWLEQLLHKRKNMHSNENRSVK